MSIHQHAFSSHLKLQRKSSSQIIIHCWPLQTQRCDYETLHKQRWEFHNPEYHSVSPLLNVYPELMTKRALRHWRKQPTYMRRTQHALTESLFTLLHCKWWIMTELWVDMTSQLSLFTRKVARFYETLTMNKTAKAQSLCSYFHIFTQVVLSNPPPWFNISIFFLPVLRERGIINELVALHIQGLITMNPIWMNKVFFKSIENNKTVY